MSFELPLTHLRSDRSRRQWRPHSWILATFVSGCGASASHSSDVVAAVTAAVDAFELATTDDSSDGSVDGLGASAQDVPGSVQDAPTILWQVITPTEAAFVAEKIPGDTRAFTCGGLVDLDGDGLQELVGASPSGFRIAHKSAAAWQIADYPVPANDVHNVACEAADLDADGDTDLVLSIRNKAYSLMNDGGLKFHVLPLGQFAANEQETVFAIGALDLNGDQLPELYLARNPPGTSDIFMQDGCQCPPLGQITCGIPGKNYPGEPNLLLQNMGNGVFKTVADSGAEDPGQSQAIGIYDIDRDGLQDILVANDAGVNRVYRNLGGMKFAEVGGALGVTDHNHGMAVAFADLDGDGMEDLAFSEFSMQYILLRTGTPFKRLGADNGLWPLALWAWGLELEDFDNDGLNDVLLLSDRFEPASLHAICPNDENVSKLIWTPLLAYHNLGKARFQATYPILPTSPIWPELVNESTSAHTVAVGDVDNDGVLDVLLFTIVGPDAQANMWLLHGQPVAGNHGLTVSAPQGAVVVACAADVCQRREVGGSHSSAALHEREVHFGIGAASSADLTIEFPHGVQHALGTVTAGTRTVWKP